MGEHFALKNSQIFVLAEAAGGVYNSDQLRVLCEVADNESAFLKITEDQRIGFMIDPGKLPDVQAQVRKSGLLLKSYKAAGVPSPRACLGELCTFAHQPSLGDALELTTHLLKSFPAPKRYSSIGVNGCGRACLGSSTEDIHVVAEETGYKVSIGGKGSDIPQQAQLLLENVSRTDLPIVIEKILAVFYQESLEGERIFDVIDRVGLTPFFNSLPEHLIPTVPDVEIMEHVDSQITNELIAGSELSAVADDLILDSNNAQTGLIDTENTDSLIDDLLESSSAEFNADNSVGLLPTSVDGFKKSSLGDDEPLVDLSADLENISAIDLNSDDIAEADVERGLLEEAEFEDGTTEDVERVRDAIRTELSMSTPGEMSSAREHPDLLDELELQSEVFENSELTAEQSFQDEDFEAELPLEESRSEESYKDIEANTAASVEHQSPSKPKRHNSKVSSPASVRSEKMVNELAPPVSGRLAIKFLGENLAVELPSGMCFELPFDAVPEGSEFSMVLPDGELRMERDGSMLAVSLGMLNMRLPIPSASHRRVA